MSDARATVERWVERFNAGDAEGISALYAEDAVNHQIALEPVVDGEWAALEWIDPDGFRGRHARLAPGSALSRS